MDFNNPFGGDNGGMNPPDPEKLIEGLKTAFNNAASKDGPNQELFQELSEKFTQLTQVQLEIDESDFMASLPKLAEVAKAGMAFATAFRKVQGLASSDSETAQTVEQLKEDMKSAIQNASQDGPYNPNGGTAFPEWPEDKNPPKKNPPKKPNDGGDFKL